MVTASAVGTAAAAAGGPLQSTLGNSTVKRRGREGLSKSRAADSRRLRVLAPLNISLKNHDSVFFVRDGAPLS